MRGLPAICLVTLLCASPAFSFWEAATAPDLLGYAPGARELAMGGSGVASAGETSATWFNPALIAVMPQTPAIGTTYYQPRFRTGYNPPDYYGHATVTVDSSVFFEHLRGRASATIMVLETARGTTSGSMAGIGAGYGRWLTPRIAVGTSVTWVVDSGSEQTTWSLALDGGVLWQATERVAFGAVLRSIGPGMDYGLEETAELPLRAAVGMEWRIPKGESHTYVLTADLTKSLARKPGSTWYLSPVLGWSDEPAEDELRQVDLAAGFEYGYLNTFFARAGVFHDKEGERTTITWGVGLRIPFAGRFAGGTERIMVDFTSFVPLREVAQPDGQGSRKLMFSTGFVL